MFYVVVDVQWSFLFQARQNVPCIAAFIKKLQKTETELMRGENGFHRNLQAQITQEGIWVYIKCMTSSPCILEGLIYTSNNTFVHFVFREEILNGDSS